MGSTEPHGTHAEERACMELHEAACAAWSCMICMGYIGLHGAAWGCMGCMDLQGLHGAAWSYMQM
eukprot:353615-Chlamydomonas_euryale.AAC.20